MARNTGEEVVRSPRSNRIIVLEELNFVFDRPELLQITKLWQNEMSVKSIAQEFKRDPDEILLALIHLARMNKIGRRTHGLGGEDKCY